MRENDPASEADNDGSQKGIFVGDGSTANYPALVLFMAGGVLGGIAVYDTVRRGSNYIAFLAAAFLCAFVAFALIMKKGSKK
jgi:asparagine N-glycosylation enzyme membrane subunit Stt3